MWANVRLLIRALCAAIPVNYTITGAHHSLTTCIDSANSLGLSSPRISAIRACKFFSRPVPHKPVWHIFAFVQAPLPSAGQSYTSAFELGMHLPSVTSRGPSPMHAQPPQWNQSSESEDLDFQKFLLRPGQQFYPMQGTPAAAPATTQHIAPPMMDWGLPELDTGQERGRAGEIDQEVAGDPCCCLRLHCCVF